MTIPASRPLIFEVKSTGSELAFVRVLRLRKASDVFGRLHTSSGDFTRLRKTSEFFGNLRKWSCRLQKSQHSQDKNLTLISQKKLAGIQEGTRWVRISCRKWLPISLNTIPRQTRHIEGVIQPIIKVWMIVWAGALWEAQLRGEILFVVRHFETFEGGNWVRMLSGFWDLSCVGFLAGDT